MGPTEDEVGRMVLGSKGYVFTLIIALMLMLTLSLILFHSQISSPRFQDTTNKMSLNELHFFVEALKNDASRAASISGQRAATYAVDHIIDTNETFFDYEMCNCTDFVYNHTGVEAAIAELLLCGTIKNATEPVGDIEQYMKNNTILDWIDRMNNTEGGIVPYNVTLKFRDLEIVMYDSFHMVIFSKYDMKITDPASDNRYLEQNVQISSIIDISTIEDPMFYVTITERIPTAIRLFSPCVKTIRPNGTIVDQWVTEGCYFRVKNSFQSPSFFDRLEGRNQLDPKFIQRSQDKFIEMGYLPSDIAIESLMNLALLDEYNVSVNSNLSQIDADYWKGVSAGCYVDGMVEHPQFRITPKHSLAYKIVGLNCMVYMKNQSGTLNFQPPVIQVPKDTKITFIDQTGGNRPLAIFGSGVMDSLTVSAWDRDSYLLNVSTDYIFTDTIEVVDFVVKVSDDLDLY